MEEDAGTGLMKNHTPTHDGAEGSGAAMASDMEDVENGVDWVLTNYNEKTSEPQSLEEELKRLQALRSYLVLDSDRELPFERLTAMASRIFRAPIALVSLVDLGRQWFLSNRGLGDVRETPRKYAFCAHAILSREDLLVVTDAREDPRFMNSPLVTSAPYIRFYAGAPLLAPEGYKLGTFCVIDSKPRPEGLSLDEKQSLLELSAMAVQALVSRRRKREMDSDKNSQLIACTAHDLLTPLSGIELSLALLKDDAEFQNRLTKKQREGIKAATECSTMLQDICRNVRSSFGETKSAFDLSFIRAQLNTVRLDDVVARLHYVVDSMEKKVPFKIVIDDNVPKEIISDAAKIFRCAMNLLSVACARTLEGAVSLTFSVAEVGLNGSRVLNVCCTDTAPAVDLDVYEHLFKPVAKGLNLVPTTPGSPPERAIDSTYLELALFSIACEMNVVGGDYGFRPRSEEKSTGSVFWFQIPFTGIDTQEQHGAGVSPQNKDIAKAIESQIKATIMGTSIDPSEPPAAAVVAEQQSKDKHEAIAKERKKRALIIEDSTIVRKMLTRSLSKLGFDVTQAENGMEGLKELKESVFDLTLCDFLMPVMDGLDCVQQYREWEDMHRPWLSQRIIGISAHASQADVDKGLKLGMNDYKNKPVTYKQLQELIATPEQQAMSERIDQLERGEIEFAVQGSKEESNAAEEPQRKRPKKSGDSSASATKREGIMKTCLILTPTATNSHLRRVHETIREQDWHPVSAHNEVEAWNFLKMRVWDIVLVYDEFTHLISDLKEWESTHRSGQQENTVLVTEKIDPTSGESAMEPTPGFYDAIPKPIGLVALKKLMKRVHGDA